MSTLKLNLHSLKFTSMYFGGQLQIFIQIWSIKKFNYYYPMRQMIPELRIERR